MRSTHDNIQLCPLQTIKVVESEILVLETLIKELELEHRHPLLPASVQCDLSITPGAPAVAPESQPGDAPGQAYARQVNRRQGNA